MDTDLFQSYSEWRDWAYSEGITDEELDVLYQEYLTNMEEEYWAM